MQISVGDLDIRHDYLVATGSAVKAVWSTSGRTMPCSGWCVAIISVAIEYSTPSRNLVATSLHLYTATGANQTRSMHEHARLALTAAVTAAALSFSGAADAAVRLPPIDRGMPSIAAMFANKSMYHTDPNRCERAYVGNTIGQANAVSDKELDLRQCKLAKADLSGKTLAGALLVDADLQEANLQEAVLTKVCQNVHDVPFSCTCITNNQHTYMVVVFHQFIHRAHPDYSDTHR